MEIMDKDQFRKDQLTAYGALEEIDRIFNENHISYFLLAGSALGAVRHGGFIPWDDDIDIGIFLDDREKVSELLARELSPRYQWADRSVTPGFPRLFGKVLCNAMGCVDVFLLVKTSDAEKERKKQWRQRKLLFKLYKAKINYANQNERKDMKEKCKVLAAKTMAFFVPFQSILDAIDKNERRFEYLQDPGYYLNLYSAYSLERELIRAEWLAEPSFITFEGGTYPVVKDVDAYLTHLYGDYMTPPPENQRQPRHGEEF